MRPKTITQIKGKTLWTPVLVPSQKTLLYYGLSYARWRKMLDSCKGLCEICERIPQSGRLVIDHEHVPGWKKLNPAKRVLYVRGLLCSTCNHYILSRFATVEKLQSAASFLIKYLERKPK